MDGDVVFKEIDSSRCFGNYVAMCRGTKELNNNRPVRGVHPEKSIDEVETVLDLVLPAELIGVVSVFINTGPFPVADFAQIRLD